MLLQALQTTLPPFLKVDVPSGRFTAEDEHYMQAVAHRDAWTDPDDRIGILLGLAAHRLRRDFVVLVQHGHYDSLLLLAEGPFRERRRRLQEAHEKVHREGDVASVFGPAPMSDLAHELWLRPDPPRILLNFTDQGLLRIRSRPDTPCAAELAARYGGGGHANAAGAPLLEGRRNRLRFYQWLRHRDPAVRRVLREARSLVARR